MRIAINGIGVAGPALAWWLRRYGHEPVLFEKSPTLRTGGYVIDFWGVGYDVAEKMGLLPALYEKGYVIRSLRMVDRRGKTVAHPNVASLRTMIGNRFVSIARGDIASIIFDACEGIESRFGCTITGIEQTDQNVRVRTSTGNVETFDLVVGADGLHSAVRSLAFGPAEQFERQLGFYVAAFALPGYQPREELTYVMHTVPKRQVARFSMRDDRTMFLFTFRAELLPPELAKAPDPKAILRAVYGDMQWEVPQILSRLDEAQDLYFDHISQIVMDHWSKDRVALLGDAAACVSLLAGEGTGLAITEAYVLAGELHRAAGDFATAFANYEQKLHPLLARKRKAARQFAGFFAPKTALALWIRDWGTKACSIPLLARWIIGPSLRDDFPLPDYEN